MNTQAVFNLRTIKDAYRTFCAREPDTRIPLRAININVLASALHYLEVSACATYRAYDPTVPQQAKFAEFGGELAERSGMFNRFALKPLEIPDVLSLQNCCSSAIAEVAPLLEPLMVSRRMIATDRFHIPLHIKSPQETIAGWRNCFASADYAEMRGELATKIYSGESTFYGSKFIIGVLGNPEMSRKISELIVGADDVFLLEHLIPVMIERFRLHFIPALATKQPVTTVPFFDPRLADLCTAHAELVSSFLAHEARGIQPERQDMEQFRLVFEAAPLGLLALLTLKDNVRSPDPKRVFMRVVEILEQIDSILGPRKFVAGQLRHELDATSCAELNAWIQATLPTSPETNPWYCKVIKYGVPLVFMVASSAVATIEKGVIGGVGGAALGIAAGTKAGYWLSEALNPHRKYNVAIRNFTAIRDHWKTIYSATDLHLLLRSKVKTQLGLKLV